jgi:hypothetical protein
MQKNEESDEILLFTLRQEIFFFNYTVFRRLIFVIFCIVIRLAVSFQKNVCKLEQWTANFW